MSLPKGRRRARSAEEKAGRQASLIAAARTALERQTFDAITMAHIAKRAGLTKASAYLYFPAKEALFLRVVEQELAAWFAGLEATLVRSKSDPQRAIPKLIARSLVRAPVLLQLLTLLHGRIETNLTVDDVSRFKQFLAASLSRVGQTLEARLALAPGLGARLLLRIHGLTIGLRQMSDPPAVVREAIQAAPELAAMTPDFESELSAAIGDWIKAWR